MNDVLIDYDYSNHYWIYKCWLGSLGNSSTTSGSSGPGGIMADAPSVWEGALWEWKGTNEALGAEYLKFRLLLWCFVSSLWMSYSHKAKNNVIDGCVLTNIINQSIVKSKFIVLYYSFCTNLTVYCIKKEIVNLKSSDFMINWCTKVWRELQYFLMFFFKQKVFKVPAYTDEQREIPFGRVNHNKYMVTDRVAYIGEICTTSTWLPIVWHTSVSSAQQVHGHRTCGFHRWVLHNKYMVTDRVAFIGEFCATSTWSPIVWLSSVSSAQQVHGHRLCDLHR